MAKYVLEAVSRTGEPVNVITGSPADSIAVYSDAELRERMAEAEGDPRQLHITVRPA